MKHILLATTTLLVPAISSAFVAPSGSQSAVSLRMSDPNYYNNQDPNYYNQDPNYYNQGSNYDAQYAQQEQQQNYYQQGQQYDQQQQQYDPNQQYNQQQQQQEEEPTLFLSNNMQEEFTKATADFATPIDFLALARQRAAEKRESINSASTDEDWRRLAEEKKMEMGGYFNEDEGWEKSLEDEGNESDGAGRGMGVTWAEGEGGVMVTESGLVVDGGEDEDGDEPKLLLY